MADESDSKFKDLYQRGTDAYNQAQEKLAELDRVLDQFGIDRGDILPENFLGRGVGDELAKWGGTAMQTIVVAAALPQPAGAIAAAALVAAKIGQEIRSAVSDSQCARNNRDRNRENINRIVAMLPSETDEQNTWNWVRCSELVLFLAGAYRDKLKCGRITHSQWASIDLRRQADFLTLWDGDRKHTGVDGAACGQGIDASPGQKCRVMKACKHASGMLVSNLVENGAIPAPLRAAIFYQMLLDFGPMLQEGWPELAINPARGFVEAFGVPMEDYIRQLIGEALPVGEARIRLELPANKTTIFQVAAVYYEVEHASGQGNLAAPVYYRPAGLAADAPKVLEFAIPANGADRVIVVFVVGRQGLPRQRGMKRYAMIPASPQPDAMLTLTLNEPDKLQLNWHYTLGDRGANKGLIICDTAETRDWVRAHLAEVNADTFTSVAGATVRPDEDLRPDVEVPGGGMQLPPGATYPGGGVTVPSGGGAGVLAAAAAAAALWLASKG